MAFITTEPQRPWAKTGQALHDALSQLAEIKMRQMMQRQEIERQGTAYNELLSRLGYEQGQDENLGQTVAGLPQNMQQNALRDLLMRRQMQQGQMEDQQGYTQNPQSILGYIPFETPQMTLQRQRNALKSIRDQEKFEYTKQRNIDKDYRKFNDEIYKKSMEAETLKSNILEAIRLIDTGKTREGLSSLVPKRLWGKEDRELDKILTEIGLQRANVGGGQMSKMKILTAQAAKPSIDMPKSAQREMLVQLLQDAEKVIDVSNMRDQIIASNNNNTPSGLDRMLMQMYHNKYSGKSYPVQQFAQQQGIQSPTEQSQSPQSMIGSVQGQQSNINPPSDSNNEDIISKALRLGVGGASRVATGLISGPGDIAQMGADVTDYVAGKFGKDLGAGEAVRKYSPLPTSEGVAKKISDFTNGYTDPKNYAEDFGYRVLDTFGAFLMPQKAVGKVAQLLGKAGVSASKAQKAENIILPFSGYVGSKKKLLGQAAALHATGDIASAVGVEDPALKTALQTGAFLLAGTAGGRKSIEADAEAKFENSKRIFGETNKAFEDKAPIKSYGSAEGKPSFLVAPIKTAVDKLKNLRHKVDVSNNINRTAQLELIDGSIYGLENSTGTDFAKLETLVDQTQSLNRRFKLSTYARLPNEPYTPIETRGLIHDMLDIIAEPIEKFGKVAKKSKDLGLPSEIEQAVTDYISAKDSWKALNKYGEATQNLVQNTRDIGHGGTTAHFVWNLLKGGLSYTARDIAKVGTLLKSDVGRRTYLKAIDAASAGNITKAKQLVNKLITMAKRENIS